MRKTGELPPAQFGKYERKPRPEHLEIIAKLKSEPGSWFEVKKFNTRAAAGRFAGNIRHGRFVAFRDGKYEATVRDAVVHVRIVVSSS